MNRFLRKKECTFGLLAALFAVLLAAPASAGNMTKKLKGDFVLSSSMTCAISTGTDGPQSGFDPVTLERLGPGVTFNANYQGVISFDGAGWQTFTGEVLVINNNEETTMAQYELTCEGPYWVTRDMMLESESTCEVLRITPGGPLPDGVPLILSGVKSSGQLLGTKRSMIMLRSDTEPNIETYTLPLMFGGMYVADRICGKTGTAVRIWN